MKIVVLFVAFLGLIIHIHAQPNLASGCVITSAGDTLKGFIEYRGIDEAYRTCIFKKDKSQLRTFYSYKPGELKFYSMEGAKNFESVIINNENQPDTVFAEVLLSGNVNLYEYNNRYFVSKKRGSIMELTDKNEVVTHPETNVIQSSQSYIRVLKEILTECPGFNEQIDNSYLDSRNLTLLFKRYHRCIDSKSAYFKRVIPLPHVKYGVYAGMYTGKTGFESFDSRYDYLSNQEWDRAYAPLIGLKTNLYFPRFHNNFIVIAEVAFQQIQFRNTTTTYETQTNTNHVVFDFHTFKIPVGLQHRFNNNPFSPFFNFGIVNQLHFLDSDWEKTSNLTNVTEEINPIDIKPFQHGFFIGLGATKRLKNSSIYFETRFEKHSELESKANEAHEDLFSVSSGINFVLGYLFN